MSNNKINLNEIVSYITFHDFDSPYFPVSNTHN